MVSEKLKIHLATSVALLLSVTPIYTMVELFLLSMPVEVSVRARLYTALTVVCGLGLAYHHLRNLSKRTFRIPDTREANAKIATHDLLFLMAFNATLTPLLYLVAGADGWAILWGTAFALMMALVNGPLNGFVLDLTLDFLGLKPSGRLPLALAELSVVTKKIAFVLMALAVLGLLVGIYLAKA